jgi:hypothetical protein
MPVQLNVLAAHYEISEANLTKSLQNFCCAALIRLCSGGLADLRTYISNKITREQRNSTVGAWLVSAPHSDDLPGTGSNPY